jgi:nucleotide-binding universal stress UspA family protein
LSAQDRRSGPIVIGFDGSAASEHALREAARLLAPRPALVVVVWEAGAAFEMMEVPTTSIGVPPAPIDVRTAAEVDRALYERAQRLAEHGATLAREAGFEAEGLAVADDVTVADTLVSLAQERDAQAVVVGAHGHRRLREALLGSTSQGVIRHAECPVLVVRGPEGD